MNMQNITSVRDIDVSGKRVLVRVDFNVPLKDGKIENDVRIKAALPTLKLLIERGASSIVVLTHLGRPKTPDDQATRVAPVAQRLRELLNAPQIAVHENLRFDPREETNDPVFAQELASLGDVYVNDAFSNSHRNHASMVGLPALLPSAAGLGLLAEVAHLEPALTPPPGSVALIGGAKFETKVPLIKKLLALYSEVLLGGALANDVIKARGLPFGASLVSQTPVPADIAADEHLVVPTDAIFAENSSNAERSGLVVDIRANEGIIDIGPATAKLWVEKISQAPFVLWNGPMGIYEQGYRDGTDVLAAALAASAVPAVVGGGDTAAAVEKYTFDPSKVFVSTGGGAMLEFLVTGTLPGIEALRH
ncbi:phosphoglycerate kinase [Candidatus Kaiserbacteria bacterium]|nr:phosphoglycerate kinase [Candidatus Kaiserbacteria bacterium]